MSKMILYSLTVLDHSALISHLLLSRLIFYNSYNGRHYYIHLVLSIKGTAIRQSLYCHEKDSL